MPITIRERFSQILDEDLELLSYDPVTARPEWFILQALPVPPVTVRPSIILETGIRSEDDLTHKMVDIIRVNQRLKESKDAGTPPLIVQDLVDLLPVPYHLRILTMKYLEYHKAQSSFWPPSQNTHSKTKRKRRQI